MATLLETEGVTEMLFTNEKDLHKKKSELRKKAFQSLIQNEDKTHNIIHKKNESPEVGNYISSHRMDIMQITEVVSTRDHKGVFKNEKDRLKVSQVVAKKVIFNIKEA